MWSDFVGNSLGFEIKPKQKYSKELFHWFCHKKKHDISIFQMSENGEKLSSRKISEK